MTLEEKDIINHQAYEDIMDCKAPSSDNAYYLERYRAWAASEPERFDYYS
jgi:uncharacterized protein YqjF (DUF2071 family)